MRKCIFSALLIESVNVFDLASSYKKNSTKCFRHNKENTEADHKLCVLYCSCAEREKS